MPKRTAPSNSASSPPCISLNLLICEGAIYPPHPHCWHSFLEFGMPKREEKQRFTPQAYVTSCGCQSLSYSTSLPVTLFLQQRMHVATCFPPASKISPLSSPFPSCACSPFRPVSSFHPISSNIYTGAKKLC